MRCHDDIGWTFSDEDAVRLGVTGFDHRRFLNSFYTGRFPGSFGVGGIGKHRRLIADDPDYLSTIVPTRDGVHLKDRFRAALGLS